MEIREENALDDLVIPDKHKEVTRALISNWKSPKLDTDLTLSKRRGTSVLLLGPPGVGKTSLVEVVAAALARPIFEINCSELGSLSRGVDTKLETWFSLAKRWDCVLLLEEADELVEQRSIRDGPDRAALPSGKIRH
jgi:SpoVK/Ycf46/Vps4 family AAA+-type ATPase